LTLLLPEGSTRQALTDAFADVLSYPYEPPAAAARRCGAVARRRDAEAGRLLESFAALTEAAPLGEVQEAYTRTFDLDTLSRAEPTCYPYVGHYLFDESHKRGAFLVELRHRFRLHGFEDDVDLADHLVVLLRFLGACDDETLVGEIVDDAVLPALARMRPLRDKAAEAGAMTVRGAYLGVLTALELSLRAERPLRADPVVDEAEREWTRDRDSLGIDRDWNRH
jgi:nitrate reductase assembly molybdenum cofactor insertion protein NarJ